MKNPREPACQSGDFLPKPEREIHFAGNRLVRRNGMQGGHWQVDIHRVAPSAWPQANRSLSFSRPLLAGPLLSFEGKALTRKGKLHPRKGMARTLEDMA